MEKLDVELVIPGAKLWSPESPFLYEVKVSTPDDSLSARFGMREFTSHPEEGVFKLNGKPYYLRGTNITFLRFSEDPKRGNLPWDREWVRRLYQNMKEFNFNSVRHCIGFPPDFWYEIADELGILIQDEFPIWLGGPERECQNTVIKTECLIAEFKEWMRERWNCPSVVIWDACNETTYVRQIAEAILAVRDLDLSGRIWDKGWGPQMRYGDSVECHPYLASRLKWEKDFKDFPQICAKQDGGGYLVVNHYETGDGPFIINEYAWLWLNRDGSPTALTDLVYEKLLGKNSDAEARRLTYARYFAMLTELWRTSRKTPPFCTFACSAIRARAGRPATTLWMLKSKFSSRILKSTQKTPSLRSALCWTILKLR